MSEPADRDGPWPVAARIAIVARGAAPDGAATARLAGDLREAGIEIVDGKPHGLVFLTDEAAADLLLIGAATMVTAEAVLELRRVAGSDPMIAAAMPRIVANDGHDLPDRARPGDVDYAVLPDPRCLYVKGSVLTDLGQADPPADLVQRVEELNRFGFRVALAGRAVARHPDGARSPETGNASPALKAAVARAWASAPAAADRLLDALRPGADGRRTIAFDLAALTAEHSGTSRLAAALIRHAAAAWPDLALHAVATEAAFAAHLGGLGSSVTRVDPSDPRTFAAAIRFGQPFLWGEIDALSRRAPVLVIFLLDTIGLDCLAHAPDELDALWRFVCQEADGLLFNSAFTERQFGRRFAIRPDLPRRASLHSLDLADYRDGPPTASGPGDRVLVVGNRFPHKRLRETAEALARAALPDPVTVLGLEPGTIAGIEGVPSGGLAPERLAALYAAAKIVVYPSVYEGFGFPTLEALAQRRPILVRDLPPYREIAAGLPEAANIHVFANDADLVARLRDPPDWSETRAARPVRTWDDAARDLRDVLDAALAGADRARVVRRIDLLRGRMSYMRTRALSTDTTDDTLERLAAAAGRLTQHAVAGLGRRLPASLLGLAARALRRER